MGCGAGKLGSDVAASKRHGKGKNDVDEISIASSSSDQQEEDTTLPQEDMEQLDKISKMLVYFKDYKVENNGNVIISNDCASIIEELGRATDADHVIFLSRLSKVCINSGMLPNMVKLLTSFVIYWIDTDYAMDDETAEKMELLMDTLRNLTFSSSKLALECLKCGILVPVAKCMKHYEKEFEKEGTEMVRKYEELRLKYFYYGDVLIENQCICCAVKTFDQDLVTWRVTNCNISPSV